MKEQLIQYTIASFGFIGGATLVVTFCIALVVFGYWIREQLD